MSDVAEVPRPDSTTAMYLVVTDDELDPPDVEGVRISRIADPSDAPLPPVALLLARGMSTDLVDRVSDPAHVLILAAEGTPATAHVVEKRVRGVATRWAREHDGVVIDALVPTVIATTDSGDEGVDQLDSAHVWFAFAQTADALETHGLARFGLPELVVSEVPETQLPMYGAVLVGLAQRLIEEWPANDPVGPATITLRDIAHGYGDRPALDDPTLERKVDLTMTYDASLQALRVALHDDPAETLFGS